MQQGLEGSGSKETGNRNREKIQMNSMVNANILKQTRTYFQSGTTLLGKRAPSCQPNQEENNGVTVCWLNNEGLGWSSRKGKNFEDQRLGNGRSKRRAKPGWLEGGGF